MSEHLNHLSFFNPSRPDPGRINLSFYLLWCLKRFYFFEIPQRSVKIRTKVIFILIQLSEMHGAGRVKTYSPKKKNTVPFSCSEHFFIESL